MVDSSKAISDITSKHRTKGYQAFIKKGLLFLFPWRDALAVVIGGTPFRFGEIFSVFVAFIPGVANRFGKIRIKSKEFHILLILLLNLIVALLSTLIYHYSVNTGFASKYIVRNIVYIFAMVGFFSSSITFDRVDVDKLMKYLLLLETLFFVVVEATGIHLYIGKFATWSSILSSQQYYTIGGINIIRFMGTTAEAGYLSPLLVMPLYYYLVEYTREKKKTLGWIFLDLILCLFTFSTAVYVFAAIVFLGVSIGNARTRMNNHKLILLFFVILAIVFLVIFGRRIPGISKLFSSEFVNKIKTFLGRSQSGNWSAMDRSQHYKNAWKLFVSGSPLQWFIGHGTGGYYYFSQNSSNLLVTEVDEAYNLFLSTLTDRGIVGFLCLVGVGVCSRKFVIKNSLASKTIWLGILAQYLHWMLTGNFWLYYFWYEIMFLVGLYRSDKRDKSVTAYG